MCFCLLGEAHEEEEEDIFHEIYMTNLLTKKIHGESKGTIFEYLDNYPKYIIPLLRNIDYYLDKFENDTRVSNSMTDCSEELKKLKQDLSNNDNISFIIDSEELGLI